MYTFKEMHISNNNPNRKVQALKAFAFHYTANYSKGANAIANRNYFANHPNAEASANYVIDDYNVVECIAPGFVAWHAGGSSYTDYAKKNFMLNGAVRPNDFTVGFEMCVNSDSDWNKTVENTIEFAAQLAIKLGVPNIELIRHYDVTGKNCPAMYVKDTAAWEQFKQRLKNRIAELQGKESNPTPTPSGDTYTVVHGDSLWSIGQKFGVTVEQLKAWNNLTSNVIYSGQKIKIKAPTSNPAPAKPVPSQPKATVGTVTASVLNVRNGASTSYKVIGQLRKGDKVNIANRVGEWYSIYYGDHGGFVHSDYIKV